MVITGYTSGRTFSTGRRRISCPGSVDDMGSISSTWYCAERPGPRGEQGYADSLVDLAWGVEQWLTFITCATETCTECQYSSSSAFCSDENGESKTETSSCRLVGSLWI